VEVHKRCTENQNRLSFDVVEQTRLSSNYIIQAMPSLVKKRENNITQSVFTKAPDPFFFSCAFLLLRMKINF